MAIASITRFSAIAAIALFLAIAFHPWNVSKRERSLLIKQLTRKVGSLPADTSLWIKSLSFEQLEQLGEALFDFEQLSDLTAWLKGPQG